MNLDETDLGHLLEQHFGRDKFEPGQEEIINSVLSGRDVLAVTHRGFDRSLCYKLPALVLDGMTLVVSRSRQIVEKDASELLPATYINSSLPPEHLQNRLWAMAQGKYRLVYAGPEQLRNRAFLFAATKNRTSLLAVEDVHCISRWGHDFRPEYMDIAKAVMEMDSQPRILALATACTEQTRDDICYQLQIAGAKRLTQDLTHSNLSLETILTLSPEEKYDILGSLVRKLQGSGIVYANSRRQTMEIYEFLKDLEPNIAVYHGGLGRGKRVQAERAFKSDELSILVATTTVSFGAGLDKSNVRYVIHFDMPDRMERYYQQISMAGGDGEPARCILIYSPSDREFHRSIIERNAMPPAEFWRLNDALSRYVEKATPRRGNRKIPPNGAMSEWLHKYFEQLPAEAQKELSKLKDEYENLTGKDKNPWPNGRYDQYLEGEHWKEFSGRMLSERRQCQICERRAENVHHRYYRTLGKERPGDVVVLCAGCHCFIHPNSQMAGEAFAAAETSEESQPKLFDAPKSRMESENPADPLVVLPYGQIELEAAIDGRKLHTAFREMENAGMLSVLPDCSMQAQVRILVPRDELMSHAVGETGQLVVKWLLENSKSDPGGEIHVDFASLKVELCRRHDVLEDFFLAMHYAGAISYKPSRKGIALQLTNLDALLVDEIFEKQKGDRYQALRDMEEYVHTRECRQTFLCDYLGDEAWDKCGKCDNCTSAEATGPASAHVPLPQYARAAMELVKRAEGRLIKAELVKILAGMEQRTTRFDKWEEFGALSIFAPEAVRRMLDLLVGHGFLKEEGERHPPIDLTGKGFRALSGELDPYEEESIVALAEDMKQIVQVLVSSEDQETESEQDRALIAVLQCAERTEGQVGRSGLTKILRGEKSKKLTKYEFDHIEQYGSLADMPKRDVLELIDTMIERGCLSVGSFFFFSMLRLTDVGRRRLERMEKRP
ncbi:RecQ family ATP-dependent DNA helicase [Candidatus Poribacteria bacterium]